MGGYRERKHERFNATATATVIAGHPCRNHRRRDPQAAPGQRLPDRLPQRRSEPNRIQRGGDLLPAGSIHCRRERPGLSPVHKAFAASRSPKS